MADSKQKYPLGSPQEHIKMCETHELPIDVICEDCDGFICGKCAKTDHRVHEWSTIPTAATQRRRGLLKFLRTIQEEKLPGIDVKLVKMSQQIIENKEICDAEIKKLQRHYDEIMTRLSDYGFIDNHRELIQLLSGLDDDMRDCKHSVRYSKGEVSDEVLENLIGKSFNFDDISLTETSLFKYGEKAVVLLKTLCEDQCYIKQFESPYIEQVNNEGEKKHKYYTSTNDMCVTDTDDVYFADFSNNSISCLSPSGSVSTVISTDPLKPIGICQSVDGGLLVILGKKESDPYKLNSHSRRLVRHITVTGDVIHEYEYQEDGHTRLFTVPYRVTQNSYTDICVVNRTNPNEGELLIVSISGHMMSVYRGQNLAEAFRPGNAVCDSFCNILVTDMNNIQIHLLSPDGEFLKFLLNKDEVHHPTRLSINKSSLWVGYREGVVKVFKYRT
ncbi:uncharacterized protein LOC134269409 [Saccostrea cucullata]|uniref:uncharacterized protein LOC134269409 n=1 Tax=Saccostrea cuccullata TaxID=36930 RepID=UPI002ECFCE2B